MKNIKSFTDENKATEYWKELRERGYSIFDIYTSSSYNTIKECFEYLVFTK